MASIQENTHLSKWGNSRAARIPSRIIEQLNLTDNQDLTVSIQDGSIVLTPIQKEPTNIHELFADWQDDGVRDHDLDWGKPIGREYK